MSIITRIIEVEKSPLCECFIVHIPESVFIIVSEVTLKTIPFVKTSRRLGRFLL
ncbi:hypothetical protein BCI9360_00135 [Bacillus sp. CECT 9360]|nr:hypothetical protein BCI9360_00135 [Bacillus sp. CECT 9360]